MPEKKNAQINVRKALLQVSFATLAAVGGAIGNPVVAGAAVLPQAISAVKSLFEQEPDALVELPVPHWWTGEPQTQSWQNVCSAIEKRLPEIVTGVEKQLEQESSYPSSVRIRRLFVEQVALHLPQWDVKAQDRYLVAGEVTPPLLEKSAAMISAAASRAREDALAAVLAQVSANLNQVQQASEKKASSPPAPAQATTLDAESVAQLLAQKSGDDNYDVYLCYDEADEPKVLEITDQLKARGILPWLDLIGTRPGKLEKARQEELIEKIPAAAIFVGERKIVDKQQLQMYSFIDQFFDREIPVIPVLLPSAPKDLKLPPYLGQFGRVDFRRSLPDPLTQLIWGITDQRPTV